ncbi:hypothetical protein BJQ94_13415 [Cryobacterium sp. SO2]|uniref:hypothetical protein n=1 Tax=Cryobacterium sp. SO2 TaxID=1897060 RepID=UPI00223D3B9F|nr:hypothetical protein [Cryobacterium sp. SO2]WEO76358.1 hypothetical protein BJQ94_13415 [Cryobacterium sp. SO2]
MPDKTKRSGWLVGAQVIGFAAATIASIIAIGAWLPDAIENVFPRQPLYAKLAAIHVGYAEDFLVESLGTPTTTTPLSGDLGWRQLVFIRDEFAVGATINDADQIVIYSVLSCSPDFEPTFTAPDSRTIQLPAGNLASTGASDAAVESDRSLVYITGGTGGSIDQLVELGGPSSFATREQSYLLGVSADCGSVRFFEPQGESSYTGFASDGPGRLQEYRRDTPPNFYTEIAALPFPLIQRTGLPYAFNEVGSLEFFPNGEAEESIATTATIWRWDLPPSWARKAGYTPAED